MNSAGDGQFELKNDEFGQRYGPPNGVTRNVRNLRTKYDGELASGADVSGVCRTVTGSRQNAYEFASDADVSSGYVENPGRNVGDDTGYAQSQDACGLAPDADVSGVYRPIMGNEQNAYESASDADVSASYDEDFARNFGEDTSYVQLRVLAKAGEQAF